MTDVVLAGRDQSALVGEHDGLGPVAQAELGEHVRDVTLESRDECKRQIESSIQHIAERRSVEFSIETLNATGADVVQGDAIDYLRRAEAGSFDIIFLDPPFADDLIDDLCRLIAERRLPGPDGYVYIEQDRKSPLPDLPEGWQVKKTKTAGNVRYSLITV